MQDARAGVAAMVAACTIWGLSPLYYKLLADVPPFEVLAHRTLWSAGFFVCLLLWQSRLGRLRAALTGRRQVATLLFAAVMISINWFLFIVSVQIGRTTDAALGYYIFPLVSVLLGMVIFGERLGRGQAVAVALAGVAVVVLSVGLGTPPWFALMMAISFGLYGVVKKRLTVGPVVSVTAEVLLLCPLAAGWLIWLHLTTGSGVFGGDLRISLLLMLSGPLTGLPLILFSYASQRVALATLGLLQYINPTLQFLCAVMIFGEPFGTVHIVAFGLIWTALALYSRAAWRQQSARRRASMTAGAVGALSTNPARDASAKP